MCLFCAPVTRRVFCTAAALALPGIAAARPDARMQPQLRLAPSESRTIAVTLDACPGQFDHRVADILIACAIPATIFVSGIWMRQNPAPLALLKSRPDLFSLQDHGARHVPAILDSAPVYGLMPAGTLPAIRAEVLQGAAEIATATGATPGWYRGAAALYSPAAIPFIESLGFKIAGFSLNADEGASLPAEAVARRLAAARDGDVIIGHINQPHRPSGAGIAAGLAMLHQAGTKFVKLDGASLIG